jgi:hypothetical protein
MYVHGRPQTFFQGKAKFSRGGKTYYVFALKTLKTYYFPLKKSQKHTILAGQGEGGGQGPPLALPCGHPCVCLGLP